MRQYQARHAPELQRRRYDDCNGACTCFKNARILRIVNDYLNPHYGLSTTHLSETFFVKYCIEPATQSCF